MSTVTNRVHQQTQIDAPVERAFEFLCRVDRQREWDTCMEHWHHTGPMDQVGTTFDTVLDLIGQCTPYTSTVVEAIPQRLIKVHRVTLKGSSDWAYRVEPAGAGTLFAIDVEYTMQGTFAGPVDRYLYHDALDRAVGQMTEHFARMVTASTPVLA